MSSNSSTHQRSSFPWAFRIRFGDKSRKPVEKLTMDSLHLSRTQNEIAHNSNHSKNESTISSSILSFTANKGKNIKSSGKSKKGATSLGLFRLLTPCNSRTKTTTPTENKEEWQNEKASVEAKSNIKEPALSPSKYQTSQISKSKNHTQDTHVNVIPTHSILDLDVNCENKKKKKTMPLSVLNANVNKSVDVITTTNADTDMNVTVSVVVDSSQNETKNGIEQLNDDDGDDDNNGNITPLKNVLDTTEVKEDDVAKDKKIKSKKKMNGLSVSVLKREMSKSKSRNLLPKICGTPSELSPLMLIGSQQKNASGSIIDDGDDDGDESSEDNGSLEPTTSRFQTESKREKKKKNSTPIVGGVLEAVITPLTVSFHHRHSGDENCTSVVTKSNRINSPTIYSELKLEETYESDFESESESEELTGVDADRTVISEDLRYALKDIEKTEIEDNDLSSLEELEWEESEDDNSVQCEMVILKKNLGKKQQNNSNNNNKNGNIRKLKSNNASWIFGNVYLGSFEDVTNSEGEFDGIVSVMSADCMNQHALELYTKLRNTLAIHGIIIMDDRIDANIVPEIPQCVAMIDYIVRKCQRVLIHCRQGISRSTSMVIAWLIMNHCKEHKQSIPSVLDILTYVKQRRTIVFPNPSFLASLSIFRFILNTSFGYNLERKDGNKMLRSVIAKCAKYQDWIEICQEITIDDVRKVFQNEIDIHMKPIIQLGSVFKKNGKLDPNLIHALSKLNDMSFIEFIDSLWRLDDNKELVDKDVRAELQRLSLAHHWIQRVDLYVSVLTLQTRFLSLQKLREFASLFPLCDDKTLLKLPLIFHINVHLKKLMQLVSP